MNHRIVRRLFLAAALAAIIPGCKPAKSDSPGSSGTYRVTLHYVLQSVSTNMAAVALPIMSSNDLALLQTQSGVTQTTGKGFVYGVIRDPASAPVNLAQIQAINDTNTVIGTVIYRTGTGFNGITNTNATGQFIIFNLDVGRINLRVIGGATGNIYVRVEADGCTSVNVPTQAVAADVMLSGVTQSYVNVGGPTPLPATTVAAIGFGAPFPQVSDGTGNYSTGPTTVDANSLHLLKVTNGANVTAYNYAKTAAVNLVQNLFSVTVAERASTDFTPATVILDALKGIIRGKVNGAAGNDGYTVLAMNNAGSIVGIAAYGDSTASNTPGIATSTDTSGIFYIYNVDPGTILLRAVKTGFAGAALVEVEADSITFTHDTQLSATAATNATISVTGSVFELTSGTVAGVNLALRGTLVTGSSDAFGAFGFSGVPSNSGFVVRTSK